MTWPRDRVLLGVIALAALLALAYNSTIHLGYGPDEPRHMNYVRLLFDEQTLPRLNPDGTEYYGAHTFHPPLYYLILLPFYAVFHKLPGDAGWHLLRLVSLCLCLVSLVLIYQIAERAGGGDKSVARFATAFVAFLPIFGMTAATINNDSAVLLAVSVFLWLLAVKFPGERSLKSAVWLGVCLGLGGLCKATALLCDGVALLFYLWAQGGRAVFTEAQTWKRLGIIAGCVALITGPWHVRSYLIYGTWTPLPPSMPTPYLPDPRKYGDLIVLFHPNFPNMLGHANWSLFYTLWSQKDWIPESLRLPIYGTLAGFCLAALVCGLYARVRRRLSPSGAVSCAEQIAARCSEAAFAANWLAVLQVAMFAHWGWAEGGRYLIPTLSGLGIALARGWRGVFPPRVLAGLTAVYVLALLALNVLCLYWLRHYLNPTFAQHNVLYDSTN